MKTEAYLDSLPAKHSSRRRVPAGRAHLHGQCPRGLVLDGLVWPRNRLLPIAPGGFQAESWPLSFTFVDAGGEVRSMRIDGPQVGHLNCAGTYA